ncbi:LOW QUALITY PROTEIN: prenyltransferase/squalene oxidase, partial [Streptomyces himastatinicus ATCC 53653]
ALARPAALGVMREAYEREGASGAFSTDPWLTGLICVGTTRSGLAPDIVRNAAAWLRAAADEDGGWELMPLDVTWSSFAVSALLEAGYAEDPRLRATRAMFHGRQQNTPFAALGCPPGYWGFSSAHSWPMALETAEISSVLLRLPGGGGDPHVRRGIDWLTRTQDSAGSRKKNERNSPPGWWVWEEHHIIPQGGPRAAGPFFFFLGGGGVVICRALADRATAGGRFVRGPVVPGPHGGHVGGAGDAVPHGGRRASGGRTGGRVAAAHPGRRRLVGWRRGRIRPGHGGGHGLGAVRAARRGPRPRIAARDVRRPPSDGRPAAGRRLGRIAGERVHPLLLPLCGRRDRLRARAPRPGQAADGHRVPGGFRM